MKVISTQPQTPHLTVSPPRPRPPADRPLTVHTGSGPVERLASCSIVITHYRTPDVLRECLLNVRAADVSTDVIVCDSDAIARPEGIDPAWCRYIGFDRNVGFAALVNAGVEAARCEFVLVVNADVVVDGGGLRAMLAWAQTQPEAGIVAPRLVYRDGGVQPSAFAFHRPMTVVYRRTALRRSSRGRRELARFERPARETPQHAEPFDVDWVIGAAMLVRRTAVNAIGPMDEGFFLYFEDVDWCLRMWQAGFRVQLVPAAVFRHGYGRASATHGLRDLLTNSMLRVHVRSAIRFFRKHGRRPELRPPREREAQAVGSRS